jgi:hypothetical protein
MKRRRDSHTPDLFRDFTPPPVVERFSPDRVRAIKPSARVKRAVAEAIRDSKLSRDQVARLMGEQLDEPISTNVLDQYTSVSNAGHNIPAYRLIALIAVTGDARILNALLAESGFVAVEAKYEALIRREMLKEAGEKLARELNSADAEWKASR